MGAFDGAAGAARGVDLLWRVHFGGRWPVASRRVTTHWMFSELLAAAYPSIEVDSEPHLRSRREYLHFGRDHCGDRSGPGLGGGRSRPGSYARRRPDNGGFSPPSRRAIPIQRILSQSEQTNRPDISELQAWMLAHPEADLSVQALADRMAMSPRSFSRLFHSEIGETPARICRTGAGRSGPLQTRTNHLASRDHR